MVEVSGKLIFLNEYRELDTVEAGDRAEAFGETVEKSNSIINCNFCLFCFFGGGGGSTKIAISQ